MTPPICSHPPKPIRDSLLSFRPALCSHLVLVTLEERERAVDLVDVFDGGARVVHVLRVRGVRSDQRVHVARFEFVRLLRQDRTVRHTVVTRTCAKIPSTVDLFKHLTTPAVIVAQK